VWGKMGAFTRKELITLGVAIFQGFFFSNLKHSFHALDKAHYRMIMSTSKV
jgi:hypothetical protein